MAKSPSLFARLTGQVNRRFSPTKEEGTSGTAIYGGYVVQEERDPRLASHTGRYTTYADIISNTSIVAAGLRYTLNLMANPTWTVEPADESDEAKELAEFMEDVLFHMDHSWSRTVRRMGSYRFYGFGIHEWIAKKREDGRVGLRAIEQRPQKTIERWDVDDAGSILGMWQTSPQTGQELYLNRKKVMYLVDDTLTDSPEGMGLLRQLVKPARRIEQYLDIEGRAFERDFRGTPVGKAPIALLNRLVKSGDITQEEMNNMLKHVEDFVKMQVKSSKTGIMMDSEPWQSLTDTGVNVSAVPKWAVELLTGESTGVEHVGAAIDRLNWDMARVLGVENLLVGSNSGSRALSEDKSRNLYLSINSSLADIAETAETDLITPIWDLNGLPDELKPSFSVEDVSFRSIEEVTGALRDMAQAGAVLTPDDPAVDDVRNLLGVSRNEEATGLETDTAGTRGAAMDPDENTDAEEMEDEPELEKIVKADSERDLKAAILKYVRKRRRR